MRAHRDRIDREWIALAAERLASVSENPQCEAQILFAHALGLASRAELHTRDLAPTPEQLASFARTVDERAAGVPLQLVLGYVDFYETRFTVTRGVFIPRPETERLVDAALEVRGDPERPGRILDLGIGSGVILLSLLLKLGNASGIGVDVSQAALDCCGANASALGVGDRVRLFRGDLFSSLPERRFDLIVSNPPYIADGAPLPEAVARYDPMEALFAGADGLAVIRRIVLEAPAWLVPGGALAVEIGEEQGAAVRDLIAGCSEYAEPSVLQDLNGKDRVAVVKRL